MTLVMPNSEKPFLHVPFSARRMSRRRCFHHGTTRTSHDCSLRLDSFREPPDRTVVTVTSEVGEAEELPTHQVPDVEAGVTQSGETGPGSSMASSLRGQHHEICESNDHCQNSRASAVTESCDTIGKVQRRDVCSASRSVRGSKTGDEKKREKPKPGRVCDDCRAGIIRNSLAANRTKRWNSLASQQPGARNERSSRSTARLAQTSLNNQTATRKASTLSSEDQRRCSASKPQNIANGGKCRTEKQRQQGNNEIHDTASPTSLNNAAVSGHVTRRSHSAKTESNVTTVPRRRCQSSDERRQRQANMHVRDQQVTQAGPFHRKCCCDTRNSLGQGHPVTSQGQTRSSSDRNAIPEMACKPWARTLRDYGGSEKSPSPVRSRRTTPESVSSSGIMSGTAKTGAEVTVEKELPANRRPESTSRVKRPIPSEIGVTKSDSTLVRTRMDKKTNTQRSTFIPPSSSLGTVTVRRPSNSVASHREQQRIFAANRQQVDNTANNSKVCTSANARGTPNRCKTVSPASRIDSKPLYSSQVTHSHNSVTTVNRRDLCNVRDLKNSPSREPAATSLEPEVFRRTQTRRRSRLAAGDDVTHVMTSPLVAKKPTDKRLPNKPNSDSTGGNLSAVKKSAEKERRRSIKVDDVKATCHGRDPELDLDQLDVILPSSDSDKRRLELTTNKKLSLSACQTEHANINVANFSNDVILQRFSDDNSSAAAEQCLISDVASIQGSCFVVEPDNVPTSVHEITASYWSEKLVNVQDVHEINHFVDSANGSRDVFPSRRLDINGDAKFDGVQDGETDGGSIKNTRSPFDELQIKHDFEFMDEILSCTTSELSRFIRSANYRFSDEPCTRSYSTRFDADTGQVNGWDLLSTDDQLAQSSTLQETCSGLDTSEDHFGKGRKSETSSVSTTDIRVRHARLVYNVHSVMSAPVTEVAQSLNHNPCLSALRLSDYVAENCHKVDAVSAEEHQHHLHHQQPIGSERRQENGVQDCSPCSDDLVLASSDMSE